MTQIRQAFVSHLRSFDPPIILIFFSLSSRFVFLFQCHGCMIYKPDRVHHCQVCGQCVLRMDHHCPSVAWTRRQACAAGAQTTRLRHIALHSVMQRKADIAV
jgi:hypothetical protein